MNDLDDLISRAGVLRMLDENGVVFRGEIEKMPSVSAVPVVRCKNCKHRPIDHREEYNEMTGFGLEFPDGNCPCRCEDGWHSWYPSDDWFCADGKRRNDDGLL